MKRFQVCLYVYVTAEDEDQAAELASDPEQLMSNTDIDFEVQSVDELE